MQFHKEFVLPFAARIIYLLGSVAIVFLLTMFYDFPEDIHIPAIATFLFVSFEILTYDKTRPFIPPIVTFGKKK